MTKFVLNADDFGLTEDHNRAVLDGYKAGTLKSASLMTNSKSFYSALNSVIPSCPKLEIAIHLNIMEGCSLTRCPALTDKNGNFNRGYLYFMLSQLDNTLKSQIESEFRAQIELALKNGVKIVRLDSHVHTHAIPEIFKIVCKLAKEYNIKQVRTQCEIPYFVFPDCLSLKFLINLVKIMLLNTFTFLNKIVLKKNSLKTNDYIIGVGYTGMMTAKTVLEGVKRAKGNTVEILIHPCKYLDDINNSHTREFLITQDEAIKEFFNCD